MIVIAQNLARLYDDIAATALAAGRAPDDIKLIAVSKTHPISSIEATYEAGQRIFGESTVQEAQAKIAHFAGRKLEWHFIGHLQSNKTKFIPQHFSWVHSLDSVKLARRLSVAAQAGHAVINALIEVNVTGDPRKHGVAVREVSPLIEQIMREDLPGLALRGLMTIGPYPVEEAQTRHTYAALRRLCDTCRDRHALPAFDELSMGMSGDYREAIQEGATLLRIGTTIFGERDYGDG